MFKKSFIDLDYVYGLLSNSDGENPLNYHALMENPAELLVVATDAHTGKVKYFDKRNIRQDHYDILKASSAIPFVCRPYAVDGILYYDGALGDPVPVQKAFECGCDRVVVILSRPVQDKRTPEKDTRLASHIQKKYPVSAQRLRDRAKRYNEGVSLALDYQKEGRVLIISPDDTCGVDTLTRNKSAMNQLYDKGYQDASKIEEFMR